MQSRSSPLGGASYGGAGSASSFGSLLTAAGASYGQTTNISAGQQPGGSKATANWLIASGTSWTSNVVNNWYCYCAGCGGDGWMPGQPRITNYMYPISNLGVDNRQGISYTSIRGGASEQATPAGSITGGNGCSGAADSYGYGYTYGGLGGWGYGSGAGGGVRSGGYIGAGSGHASGVLATLNHVLANTSSVSVTVGTGGAYSANNYGGGCNGAVAVFW